MDRSLFLKRREDNKRKFGELVVELDQHPEVVGYKKKKGWLKEERMLCD